MLAQGTVVEIVRTGGYLEGVRGTIEGVHGDTRVDKVGFYAYIIEIDLAYRQELRKLGYHYNSIVMTNACIEVLEED